MDVKSDDESTRSCSPISSMSLDVLAQVASDRLETVSKRENEVCRKRRIKIKKKAVSTKRSFQSMDRLNLSQISSLSEKLLISMFTEMISDELRKQFTVKCALEPSACSCQVTVYGNEMKAKMEIKRHLLVHIAQLKETYKDNPDQFTSETANGRKKRLLYEHNKKIRIKRKLKSQPVTLEDSANKRRGRPPNFPQTLQDYMGLGLKIDTDKIQKEAEKKDQRERQIDAILSEFEHEEVAKVPAEQIKTQREPQVACTVSSLRGINTNSQKVGSSDKIEDKFYDSASFLDCSGYETSQCNTSNKMNAVDTEQLIIDLFSRCQPYQDHNYTSILGKKKGIELMTVECESDDEKEDKSEAVFSSCRTEGKRMGITLNAGANVHSVSESVSLLHASQETTELSTETVDVACESTEVCDSSLTPEIIAWEKLKRIASKITSSSRKTQYPPMPAMNLDKQGVIPEEALLGAQSESDNEADDGEQEQSEDESGANAMVTNVNPYKRGRRSYDTLGGEWERKVALKCIRELRNKKKEETSLTCKICKNRVFTATATLMYHYRSHAGIKPFLCLICATTFTRQHSLNYHMLIHNNQSRFTCRECGRKFRHPSHFKEHMRRHTGETPYHCTDCPLKFKTRNTYKRHLKTRHDKMLTIGGIRAIGWDNSSQNSMAVKIEENNISNANATQEKPIKIDEVKVENTETGNEDSCKIKFATNHEKQEENTKKPQVTQMDDIAGIQSILNNTVQFKLKENAAFTTVLSSSATTPQSSNVQATSALKQQLPATESRVNISGLQLQINPQMAPSPLLASPETKKTKVIPVVNTPSAIVNQTVKPMALPILQNTVGVSAKPMAVPIVQKASVSSVPMTTIQSSATASQVKQLQIPFIRNASVIAASKPIPLVQNSALKQATATPVQLPILQESTVNTPGMQIRIPMLQPANIAQSLDVRLLQPQKTQLQIPIMPSAAMSQRGASVQILQTPHLNTSGSSVQVLQTKSTATTTTSNAQYLLNNNVPIASSHAVPITFLQVDQFPFQLTSINNSSSTLSNVVKSSSDSGEISIIPFHNTNTVLNQQHVQVDNSRTALIQQTIPSASSAVMKQSISNIPAAIIQQTPVINVTTHNTPAANTLLRFVTQVANQN